MPQVPFTPTGDAGAIVAELKMISARLETTNTILAKVGEILLRMAEKKP